MIFKYTIVVELLLIHALWIAWFLLFLLELALLGNVIQESLQWHLCSKNNCTKDLTRYLFEFSEKSRKCLLTPSLALSLWIRSQEQLHCSTTSCAPLGGPLLSGFATPPLFFSVTLSKLSKENAHFLCAKQRSLLLCLVVPQYNITTQKRLMRPTHGQWRHINPHERPSSVNSPLGLLFFFCMMSILPYLIHSWSEC